MKSPENQLNKNLRLGKKKSRVVAEEFFTWVDAQIVLPKSLIGTTGAITACGLIELSKVVPEFESQIYLQNAIKILKALEENCVNWELDEQAVLTNGTVAYDRNINVPIIYGDYYFVETISKIHNNFLLQ